MTKQPALTDVAVLMLFFNRPDSLRLVFEQVRRSRPSRLLLYQDGPRGEQDRTGIQACRDIVSDERIDWECEVHRQYLDHNQGCDPSGFLSHQWAFSIADKVIVLEDDIVPSLSFIPFCKEMLDRYEHDDRITMIAGFNTDEVSPDVSDSYFFTTAFSIWGWASWRRVARRWDARYAFIQDPQAMRQLETLARQRGYRRDMIRMFRSHSQSGKAYFETIYWADLLLNSGLIVMPGKNMVRNVGATDNSTHYAEFKTLPHDVRRLFTMESHELEFPLRHPRYVIENVDYQKRMYKANAWGHPLIKIRRSLEELCLNLRYGNFGHIGKSIVNRLRKWTGKGTHA